MAKSRKQQKSNRTLANLRRKSGRETEGTSIIIDKCNELLAAGTTPTNEELIRALPGMPHHKIPPRARYAFQLDIDERKSGRRGKTKIKENVMNDLEFLRRTWQLHLDDLGYETIHPTTRRLWIMENIKHLQRIKEFSSQNIPNEFFVFDPDNII
jgi:hypothetical protein